MSKQYGFYFDESRCIQCRTCEMSCKSAHNVEPGVKLRHVLDTWKGQFPDVTHTFFSLACMHCEQPACVAVCPTGAIIKRADDGIVVVDSEKCNGCQDCSQGCPYHIPQFGKDGKMQKCDFCLSINRTPACTESCPAEALYFGTIDELLLMAKYKNKVARRMEGSTQPYLIIVN
jgi:anaerobic dimethyl sulfoxide reductase subunit B (iron-sulfur subunit)